MSGLFKLIAEHIFQSTPYLQSCGEPHFHTLWVTRIQTRIRATNPNRRIRSPVRVLPVMLENKSANDHTA